MEPFNITFTVPGAAVPKGRPKFARRGKFVSTYTPEKTVTYENLVKSLAEDAMKERGYGLNTGPLSAVIGIALPVPSSWNKKLTEAAKNGLVATTKRPDLDNCIKSIFDAMNGTVFSDDSQIVQILAWKFYAEKAETNISIISVDQEAAK